MKPADIVKKTSGFDTGKTGLILSMKKSVDFDFLKVLCPSGALRVWNSKQVEVISEN